MLGGCDVFDPTTGLPLKYVLFLPYGGLLWETWKALHSKVFCELLDALICYQKVLQVTRLYHHSPLLFKWNHA